MNAPLSLGSEVMRLQQIVSAENLAKHEGRAGSRADRAWPRANQGAKKHRREGKGPCLTDAAHLTFSRRPVRVLGRYAMIRTCSIALSGFLCGGGVIKTSFARDLSPMATDCNAPPLASDCQAGSRRNGCNIRLS